MDPFSLFLGGVGAIGSLIKGFGASAVDDINSQILRGNAELYGIQANNAREDANFAFDRGNFDQAKLRRTISQTVGAQTAYFGANNLDPAYGSPLLLAARTVVAGETDAAIIGVNARVEAARALGRAASLDNNAASSGLQAVASDIKSTNDMIAGILGAGTSLLMVGKGFKFGSGTSGDLGALNIGSGASPFMLNFKAGA